MVLASHLALGGSPTNRRHRPASSPGMPQHPDLSGRESVDSEALRRAQQNDFLLGALQKEFPLVSRDIISEALENAKTATSDDRVKALTLTIKILSAFSHG